MKLFRQNPKFTKNYLRLYANLGKDDYSNDEKKDIVNKFVTIAKFLNPNAKLKFDI